MYGLGKLKGVRWDVSTHDNIIGEISTLWLEPHQTIERVWVCRPSTVSDLDSSPVWGLVIGKGLKDSNSQLPDFTSDNDGESFYERVIVSYEFLYLRAITLKSEKTTQPRL